MISTGCTKLGRNLASSGSGNSSNLNLDPNSGNFMLLTVLPSQQSAGSQYDLVGQSNEFETYCGDTSVPCICIYSYTQGGTPQTAEATATDAESNMIRCANQVPSGISAFDVKVVTNDRTLFSNSISVNLNNGTYSGSTLYLDLSNSESFVQAKRFQCRRNEFIANPMDNSIVDPLQSDDPRVIYPFNFYTTNVSESLLQMQRLGNQSWECSLTETKDRSLHWWANPHVYSSAICADSFCAGDGELMYPQSSLVSGKIPVNNLASVGKRRGSFWMAKQSYGVFQIPVQVALAPKDYVSATYGVIGYAAKPLTTTSGSSVCPSISLPAKSTWVKIWNYRATDITPPKKVTAAASITASAIACNPSNASIFDSCSKPRTPSGADPFGYSIGSPEPVSRLASRIAALDTSGGNTAHACYNIRDVSWVSGAETWTPSLIGFGDPAAGGTIAAIRTLPWSIYSLLPASPGSILCEGDDTVWRINVGAVCPANTVTTTPPVAGTPSDSQLTSVALSPDNYTDQIFVVTDPDVDDNQMRNQSSSVAQYRPVTYRSSQDCSATTRAGCPASKEIHWDINVKAVGDAASADLYPLCVLQFYD